MRKLDATGQEVLVPSFPAGDDSFGLSERMLRLGTENQRHPVHPYLLNVKNVHFLVCTLN